MSSCTELLVALLLLAVPIIGHGQPAGASSLNSLLVAAKQAQARSDYHAAATYYQQAVKMAPQIPELWANLGLMQQEAGKDAEAMQSFRQAIRLNPALYVPNLFLGIDSVRMGKASEAVAFLLKAQRQNPKDPQVPLTLGDAYKDLDKFSAASHAYRQALRLDPGRSTAWFSLGISYADAVESDARLLSSDNQNSSFAKALFAESLTEQGRYKEAVDLYKNVLNTTPQPSCMQAELAMVYLLQHDTNDAKQQLDAEHPTHPGCLLADLGYAKLQILTGSNQEALETLRKIWGLDSGFIRAHIAELTAGLPAESASAFMDTLTRKQDETLAQKKLYALLSEAFQGSPGPMDQIASPEFLSAQPASATYAGQSAPKIHEDAEKYFATGQYQKCVQILNVGIPHQSEEAVVLLATCAYFDGEYEIASNASDVLRTRAQHSTEAMYWSIQAKEKLALIAFSQFEQSQPNSERTHLLLGDMYRQRQKYEAAELEYKKAATISPDDPAPLYGLAAADSLDSKVDEATTICKEALSRAPNDPDFNLLMGEILVSQHQWTEAGTFLEKGLGSKPQMLPHVHALLGEMYAETGRLQEAIPQLQLGLDSDEDGTIHYRLARIYFKLGDTAEGKAALQQVKSIQQKRRARAVMDIQDSTSHEDNP